MKRSIKLIATAFMVMFIFSNISILNAFANTSGEIAVINVGNEEFRLKVK